MSTKARLGWSAWRTQHSRRWKKANIVGHRAAATVPTRNSITSVKRQLTITAHHYSKENYLEFIKLARGI